ncbi:MAG: hypothetical protein WDM79_01515 [Terricaulis sp.]
MMGSEPSGVAVLVANLPRQATAHMLGDLNEIVQGRARLRR